MTEAKAAHTAGPWKIQRRSTGPDNNGLSICLTDPKTEHWPSASGEIARVIFKRLGRGGRSQPNEADYANARLIAAAPQMLEALEKILVWAERQATHDEAQAKTCRFESLKGSYEHDAANFRKMARTIRSAIAAARGEGNDDTQ